MPEKTVHLPALLSDHFGVATSIARMQIALGKVEIDGEPWEGDPLDIPRKEIVGKTVTVRGPDRAFRFEFPEDKQ